MKQPAPDFSKAGIKSRLTQKAAELWGYQEADMDGFDPLVHLLLEACAVEFEKIGQEINNTQFRLVERLAGLLNPDVVDTPRPAHAVAQARAREPQLLLPSDAQFVFQPAATMGRQVGGHPLYFSPLQPTRLTDCTVRCLATDEAIWQVEAGQKQLLAQVAQPIPAEQRRLWIGLSMPSESTPLTDLSFYFNWPNEPRREAYAAFLPGETWLLGEQTVSVASGFASVSESGSVEATQLHEEFDVLLRLEQHIRALYAPLFVHLTAAPAGRPTAQLYPTALASRFSPDELRALATPLVWLEVRFSSALPPEALRNVVCEVNCFPVLNRRLNKRLFRLQQALNIFPLEAEEAFLAIREVYSLSNVVYRSTTLSGLQDTSTDTYTLRAHGVGRFDNRSGQEALTELLELLRDESRAFAATGTDFISSTLRELSQSLARLEDRLANRPASTEAVNPYLVLRPKDTNDSVFIEYWSCDGEGGNRLPAGSALRVYDGHYLEEVRLLTTTQGGRERPRPEERIFAMRRNLLSRNRIVTLEDIKAACQAELGNRLGAVRIEKAFRPGLTPTAGFERCIRVTLTPTAGSRLTPAEWQRAAEELQVTLASQSAMNLPYEVQVGPAAAL
ncbi:type VI secretion system baseplate subunit TssF [Hymenobacter weizhouensis]|uniref:type VI secretion system baseplate subunit TssF n=1 Tax=Hymenobacter sp. YIM 151500-1 TaxID=2987689 RepID=UPI002225C743|nr:type VI secretion system baseplate subunit TssF [Hymenobacter sp. YIM 151500-1]UYZ62605.1 type VI secretion system baseplate subunit TssF [Hymenobacter sp. YIM 151500-1]